MSEKKAVCKVTSARTTLAVTSPTGRSVVIKDVHSISSSALTYQEWALVQKLRDGEQNVTRDVELSYTEMKTFAEACKKLGVPVTQEVAKQSGAEVHAGIVATTAAAHALTNSSADYAEARIRRLQKIVEKVSNDTYVMLVYDIPTSKNDDCPNPSGTLWRHGFRMNLSCWVLPSKQLDSPRIKRLLAHWQAHKIKVHIVPYAKEAIDQIRAIARENLDEEVRRVHTALITNIDSADRALSSAIKKMEEENTCTNDEQQREVDKRNNKVRAQFKLAAERLDAAIQCAEVFDESENMEALIVGVREAIRSQQETFNVAMREAGKKVSDAIL
jgi:hypothetical protein